MSNEESKRTAALAALNELPDAGVIGLGTGSTATLFIEALAERVRGGARYVGVPTSDASETLARQLGIPLAPAEDVWSVDVTVDGADEVDSNLNLIKGGGGAHTREKIVNFASEKNVIIVDESKISDVLGRTWAVPVEVLRFGHRTTAAHLARHGQTTQRQRDGKPAVTDSGNYLYDVRTGPIHHPERLSCELSYLPGVVDSGLFVQRADVVLVAGSSGVRRLTRT